MIFFDNTISKENKYKLNRNIKYLKVINSFKNQVHLNNVLYDKKHYNYYFYNKISKSINRLSSFLDYFSFGVEKEKYLSFDFLSSFFLFKEKLYKNNNLENKNYNLKVNKLNLINNNFNFLLLKKKINNLIYLKKYNRLFTFLFIDDSFFFKFLNYSCLLNLKKLIILDYIYFYLFFKNINLINKYNNNVKILYKKHSFKVLYSKAKFNLILRNHNLSSLFNKLINRRIKSSLLSFSLRIDFFKNSNFMEVIKREKKNYFISLLNNLNLRMSKKLRMRIKAFFKKYVIKEKKLKFVYIKKFKRNKINLNKKRKNLIYNSKKSNNKSSFFNIINEVNSVILNNKQKFKKMSKFKVYNDLLNKELKFKNNLLLKKKSLNFYNLISNEYFKVNKLILKNFLENKLNKNTTKDLKKLNKYILSYKNLIYKYKKYNIKYYNKLSLNQLKYNKIMLNNKSNKTSLNLFFYKRNKFKDKNKRKNKMMANSIIKGLVRRNYIYINNKKVDIRKYIPKRKKTKKEILYRRKKQIYFFKFITKLYKIKSIKNKKKFFFLNRFKENKKISLNILNLNKFSSNIDFENMFNYRLNTFSNFINSKVDIKTYLNYFPNMYFLIKFTDNFLNQFSLDNKIDLKNIMDFFLSLFNYDSLFYFKSNINNNRFPNYYSDSFNLKKLKINLSFNYIYPKIYEYNYLKVNNSIESKKTYYSNFFVKHRNFYDSNFNIDLLFQNKKELLNNYILGVYNKLLDNSFNYSSLLRDDLESNNNISNYIWMSMLDKDFEKKNNKLVNSYSFFQKDNNKKINSKFNFNENIYISRDYIKFFFFFIKNNIKKSLLKNLKKNSKDNLEIIDINKKKIENFDFQYIKSKFNFQIFEKSELYNFFFDIFLKKYNEKQNLKKLINIDIFDFNYVLKMNNKFLDQLYTNKIKNKESKLKFKNFLSKYLNEIDHKENLEIQSFDKSFFKKYENFKDLLYLKLFFPNLLNYLNKRSLKFSKVRKFKTVKFSQNIYSINNFNKSVIKKRRIFAQFYTKMPFKFNIYPIYIPNFNKKKSKIYIFRKRSKLKFGHFYFLDLYQSYFKLKDIQLKKYMIENKLSNYFNLDLYIKNIFFAVDLINIKKKNYVSDENNYYYNSSYFSNLIYNKIYVNKLKIFFKDENFHNKVTNLDKKIFMDFSISKMDYNKSLIDFNDSFFFQSNLFKFMHRIKKHKFFFNKYLFKIKKRLSINSLNFYYKYKSKNLNISYLNLIKNEISYKNNNYILYQYLTKYNKIKKKSFFLKKFTKKILGRNSKRFFLFRSFLKHLKNVYNTKGKSGKTKDIIINYLLKRSTSNDIFYDIKKKVLKYRYKFFLKFFYNFMLKYNNKYKNLNKLNLNYFNLIYLNKLEISNLNLNNSVIYLSNNNKNNIKLYDFFFSFNFLKKKLNNNIFIDFIKNKSKFFLIKKNSIENLVLLNFLSNRKSYLLYMSLNTLIENKDILNKYNYLFNNKLRNKYFKDSLVSSIKLFSNNLIESPKINLYKVNYINNYFNILLYKNKLLNEILININKNIIKIFNFKFTICNIRKIFINFLNNNLFKSYNNKIFKFIIYKYKFNKIYSENIIKKINKAKISNDNYYFYLLKKTYEFFGKLKYVSYNLIYKTHEVKNLNIYNPLNISFNLYFFINNYNNFFELKNSFNLKGYSQNFKNIGGVLLFKIGL